MKPAGRSACRECPLRRATCVPTERHGSPKIAIVGESPGRNEIEQGCPLLCAHGQATMQTLHHLGYDRSDVLWTNAALCPGKESELLKASRACRQRLESDLEDIEHVITLGGWGLYGAIQSWRKRKPKVLEWRGSVIRAGGKIILPTIHPAFVMRVPLWSPVLQCDFERIGRIIENGYQPPEKLEGSKILLATSLAAIERELEDLSEEVEADVETVGTAATSCPMVCVGIGDAKKAVVIPWSKTRDGRGRFFGRGQERAARLITAALSRRVVVTHNGLAFDHIVLARHGIEINRWDDTLLAHHAYASHMPKRLSHVATMYLDVPPWKFQVERTIRDHYRYNGQDVIYGISSWTAMQEELAPERRVYEQDKIVAELCRDMQINGFRFDHRRAKKLRRALRRAERKCSAEAEKVMGYPINLNSHVQLRKALLDDLGAPYFFSSKSTGMPSLDVNTLQTYLGYADPRLRKMADLTLTLRRARKMRGTYIDRIVTDEKGRFHPNWRSYGAVSGRFASDLMQLPRPENDPVNHLGGIRSLYIASPGHTLIAFDWRQLEMRIAAYYSDDDVMIAACETSDLHAANAELVWEEVFRSADEGTKKALRNIAKQAGFAIAYMASAATVYARILATGQEITLQQVEKMLRTIQQKFHQYYAFQNRILEQTIRTGYVEAPISKRKRRVGHAPKPTEVANFPIQSGASALINKKLPEIVQRIPRDVMLVAQVHDSAIFDTPNRHVEKVKAVIRKIAESPEKVGKHTATFPIDLKCGERWSDL